MGLKYDKKKPNKDEIWKKIIPQKIAIKRIGTKVERLKNYRRWN